MTIRAARVSDAQAVAQLVYSAAVRDNDYVFATKAKGAIDFFQYAFEQKLGIWSYSFVKVYEIETQVVATISTYPQSALVRVMLSGLKAMISFYGIWAGFGVILRSIRIGLRFSPIPKHSAYIFNVATHEGFRGRGLSPQLYESVHKQWMKDGVMRATVDVETDNHPSIRVLEKMGYENHSLKTPGKSVTMYRFYKNLSVEK
ncbi:MAG: GNAT family N-acetyltransferase [Proteobacteria bacterium]|nr:MAG: GNAT family N-acetyltransferase [Pseudomonadota bacterium]